jgi:hypothetical protein
MRCLLLSTAMIALPPAVFADQPPVADSTAAGSHQTLLTMLQEEPVTDDATADAPPSAPAVATSSAQESASLTDEKAGSLLGPFAFDITYYYYTDYIFRGINFSNYPGERGDDPNHQLTTSLDVDLADLFGAEPGTWGIFNFSTFFEWFAGQDQIDPDQGGQNLQEVDYSLSWSYDIEPIATNAAVGFTFYTFPNAKAANTEEIFVAFAHNDAWMWKWLFPDNEDGILNPSLFYAHDVGAAAGGGWLELGISHDFVFIEHLTVTPSFTLAFDRRYIGRTLDIAVIEDIGLAYLQYGLDLSYDLTGALKLSDDLGTVTLGGFLYFNDARDRYNKEDSNVENVLFGGVSLGWAL